MTPKKEVRETITGWWNPAQRIRSAGLAAEWQARETRALLLNARLVFGIAALVYVAHIPLVDLPLHKTPQELWLAYRLGLAGLCLAAFVLTLIPRLWSPTILQAEIAVVGLVTSYLQTVSMFWSPLIPYFYSLLIPALAAVLLRLPVAASVVYLVSVIGLEWPLLLRAGVPPGSAGSATIVAVMFVAMLRSRMTVDVAAFLAECETRQANEELQRANEAKTRFFATVNHELRTPLMLILGPLHRLLSDTQVSEARPLLETMAINGERLLRQVNQTLDLAKLEVGRLQAELAPGNLEVVAARMVKAARGYAEARDISLSYETHGPIPETSFDAEHVQTILANLISNALKFTPRGGRVSIETSTDSDHVVISVTDTGEGISAEHLEKIFEPFHQVDGSSTRRHEGTGLGLPLARELARLHNGELTVESTVGRGSCFRLALPAGPPSFEDRRRTPRRREDKIEAVRKETLLARHYEDSVKTRALFGDITTSRLSLASLGVSADAAPLNAPHLLVVEDSADMRVFLQQSLRSKYQVDLASNGVEALEQLQRQLPDVVITDVMMPQMDGYALCKIIRKDGRWSSLPIIVLTAKAGADAVVEGLAAGASDYLPKPFDMRELRARIDVQLKMRALQREVGERDHRLAAIGRMTSSIVHDLNNPLSAILMAAGAMLTLGRLDESTKDDVKTIIAATERLGSMVRDIKDFASLGTLELHRRQTPMAALVQEVGYSLQQRLGQVAIRLDVEADESARQSLEVDRDRLRRVIENLVGNAREALEPQQRGDKRIWLQARGTTRGVELRVADNGPGVPAQVRMNLFQPFVTVGKPNGTGLGLSIVQNLVLAHGGSVELEDTPPEGGAAFRIWLPRSGAILPAADRPA